MTAMPYLREWNLVCPHFLFPVIHQQKTELLFEWTRVGEESAAEQHVSNQTRNFLENKTAVWAAINKPPTARL